MKYKAKGLVFAGFAAAILASANGAFADYTAPTGDANRVTSQKYTQETYQQMLGGSGTANKLVQMQSNSKGDAGYIGISDSKDDVDSSAQPGGLVSGKAVGLAMDELETALTSFETGLDGDNVYTDVADVVAQGTEGQEGYVPAHKEVQIIAGNLVTSSANVNATGTETVNGVTINKANKLVTAGAVQPKTTSSQKKMVADPSGGWSTIDTAVIEASNSYVDVAVPDTNGAIALDIKPDKIKGHDSTTPANDTLLSNTEKLVTEQILKANIDLKEATANKLAATYDATTQVYTNTIATNASNTNFPTSQNVKEYVTSMMGGYSLPAMPSECQASNVNCALVSTGAGTGQPTNMVWRVMAGN